MKCIISTFILSCLISGCGNAHETRGTSSEGGKESAAGTMVAQKDLAQLAASSRLDPALTWKGPRLLREDGHLFAIMIADRMPSDPEGAVRVVVVSDDETQGAIIVPDCGNENFSMFRRFTIRDGMVKSAQNGKLGIEPYLIAQSACADRSKGTATSGGMVVAARKASTFLAKADRKQASW